MSVRDPRSIGELLLQADITTRGLLFDVTGDDAPALLRTFGEVVESAAELWRALPTSATPGVARGGVMSQLEAIAKGMHRTQLRRNWPGAGPTDPRLVSVARTFTHAADLLARHAPPSAPALSARLETEVSAAQMRTMHALYVCSHAVAVSVGEHVRSLHAATAMKNLSSRATRGIPRGQEALSRLTAFEQLAGAYVGSRLVTALGGQHADPYAGLDRLMDALAGWDLAAHRSLARTPSAATIATVARGQAMTARCVQVMAHAAARTGQLDAHTYDRRLASALEHSTQAFSRLARLCDALTDASTRKIKPDLWETDAELQAASRELIHDGTTLAAPEVIAGRAELSRVGLVVASVITSGLEVATAVRDITATGSRLYAPAQLMLNAARQEIFGLGPGERETVGNLFAPRDLQLGRSAPLIEPIREALARASVDTVEAMSAASSAACALGSTLRVGDEPTATHDVSRPGHVPAPGKALAPGAGLGR